AVQPAEAGGGGLGGVHVGGHARVLAPGKPPLKAGCNPDLALPLIFPATEHLHKLWGGPLGPGGPLWGRRPRRPLAPRLGGWRGAIPVTRPKPMPERLPESRR